MAGNGPVGDPYARRNASDFRTHKVESPKPCPPPALPAAYSPVVLDWYDTWTKVPQAALFTATDWQRLVMVAALVESYYEDPKTTTMAEIRLNESLLGATVVDRLRAKVEFVAPKAEPEAKSTDDLKARREGRKGRVA